MSSPYCNEYLTPVLFLAVSTAFCISSSRPLPVVAIVFTIGIPRSKDNSPESIMIFLFPASSIRFKAATIGMPRSMNWISM